MATTQTLTPIVAGGTSVPASGSVGPTAVSTSGVYSAQVYVSITNGSTAPTAGCVATVQASPDGGTTYYLVGQLYGTTAASTTSTAVIDIPTGATEVNVTFSGNTGSAVTVEAQLGAVTAI